MAYVRKTETLVDDIRKRCNSMSIAAQERFDVDAVSFTDAQKYDLIEAAHVSAWREAPELRTTLPDAWVSTPDKADLRIYGPKDADGNATRAMIKEISGAFKLPCKRGYHSSRPDVDVLYENLPATLQEIVSKTANNRQKQIETKAKFDLIQQQLRDYMKQHASLNTALKEMPQLEMYVPDMYMRKIRAESAPRAKAEPRSNIVELNIDVDALAAAAITHRIATA